MKTCQHCKYAVKNPSGILGECHRYPAITPITKNHWCGEHVALPHTPSLELVAMTEAAKAPAKPKAKPRAKPKPKPENSDENY